jgi:hypothetical protein
MFLKSQNLPTLTKFIAKIIYNYNTKCIPYKNIHHDEFNDISSVFYYIVWLLKNTYMHYILIRREYRGAYVLFCRWHLYLNSKWRSSSLHKRRLAMTQPMHVYFEQEWPFGGRAKRRSFVLENLKSQD